MPWLPSFRRPPTATPVAATAAFPRTPRTNPPYLTHHPTNQPYLAHHPTNQPCLTLHPANPPYLPPYASPPARRRRVASRKIPPSPPPPSAASIVSWLRARRPFFPFVRRLLSVARAGKKGSSALPPARLPTAHKILPSSHGRFHPSHFASLRERPLHPAAHESTHPCGVGACRGHYACPLAARRSPAKRSAPLTGGHLAGAGFGGVAAHNFTLC